MKYLFDTNTVSYFLNGRSAVLKERMAATSPALFGMCSVVWAELFYGARKSAAPEKTLRRVVEFAMRFPCLDFDYAAASPYGDIRASLEMAGRPIGPNDLMISAIARQHGLILLTHNSSEFSRVDGLLWEDWTVAAA